MSFSIGAGVTELKSSKTYHPVTGTATVRRFRGLPSFVQGLASSAYQQKLEFAIIPEEGVYDVIEITFPDLQDGASEKQVTTTWSFHSGKIEKSGLEHPNSIKLGAATLATITTLLGDTTKTPESKESEIRKAAGPTNASLAIEFYNTLLEGATAYEVETFVLRKTQLASEQSDLRVSTDKTGQVYKPETLYQEEKPPANFKVTLPTKGFYKKSGPNVDQQTDGQWICVEEWEWLESYSKYYYGEAI